MDIGEREQRVTYLRGRVENAERIGKPGHIARCRRRLEGAQAILVAHLARVAETD